MDFESDEMFKLLKVQMTNWSKAARIAQVAAAQAQPGANGGPAAAAGLATKNKAGKKDAKLVANGQPAEEEKKESVYVPDNTPVGQKKDMTKPMANEYIPKQVEAAWYAWW